MPRKWFVKCLPVLAVLATTGCCRWCERHCASFQHPPTQSYQPCCCCIPCCPANTAPTTSYQAPAPVNCPPGCVPAQPANGTWNRQYSGQPGQPGCCN